MKRKIALLLACLMLLSLWLTAAAAETAAYIVNDQYMLGEWTGSYSGRPSLLVGKIQANATVNVEKYEPNEVSSNGYRGAWYVTADYWVKVNNLILKELLDANGGDNGELSGTEQGKIWLDSATGNIVAFSSRDGSENLIGKIEEYGTVTMKLDCAKHTIKADVSLSYLTLSASVSLTMTQTQKTPGHYATLYTPGAEASCTQTGLHEYWDCALCSGTQHFSNSAGTGSWDSLTVSATGHDIHYCAPEEPTCWAAGHKESWYCSRCGQHFTDENAHNETTKEALVLPMLNTLPAKRGQLNGDTVTDVQDLTLLAQALAQRTAVDLSTMDINGDGVFNAADLTDYAVFLTRTSEK